MIIQEVKIIKLIKIFQILTLDMYQMTKKKHLLNKFLNRDINWLIVNELPRQWPLELKGK